ncbi:Uncharacterized protein APZ42_014203 [Daphnia magna]|uniref:Uncharacterized protein n=2 Tax=Daphnia magna TaxID=35525 RepID=A0A0P5YLW6_9CRUS|nr:hypothetical protein OUZ56_028796 [Daphnia magna]KZS19341.1 Uncharacterized protein APZ42_014203 [Daphnia magna]
MYSLRDFSQKEKELMKFAELSGIVMNPRILRSIIELLQANTSPASIIQMLNELSIFRVQEKTRRQKMLKHLSEK